MQFLFEAPVSPPSKGGVALSFDKVEVVLKIHTLNNVYQPLIYPFVRPPEMPYAGHLPCWGEKTVCLIF